jgi:hypothetical protein
MRKAMSRCERGVVVLELFLAIGALFGGLGMLRDTSGRGLGFPADLLVGTPFHSYLIPGITLLGLNGLLPAAVAVLTIRRRAIADYGHLAVAAALAGWIAGETYFIGLESWMQPFFFAYALVIGALGVQILRNSERSRTRVTASRRLRTSPS